MNDNYLWDKSGEPDPEVEELEQILGTLRYQPKELEIPADIRPHRRSHVTRGLAIAAAIALVALGLGVWRAANRTAKPEIIAVHQPNKVVSPEKTAVQETTPREIEQVKPSTQLGTVAIGRRRHRPSSAAKNRSMEVTQPKLSESEVAEAKAAKDQLILALRVASTKLNQAQRKMLGNNEIHNQHKTG